MFNYRAVDTRALVTVAPEGGREAVRLARSKRIATFRRDHL
ncbi:MAG TPA: hypothetical protein VKT82_06925 [Ktedonobacterales bacterium]|nr:hypothetical protein [Ktedonobacterales bacterium]